MTDSLDDDQRRRLLGKVIGKPSAPAPALAKEEEEGEVRPGSRFGEYEILEELGRGGMGLVHEARSRSIHQRVALKRLRDGEWAKPAEVRRFLREAEAAANLHHEHIVPVLHFGEYNGQPFFTMPVMEGGNLASHMARRAHERETQPTEWATWAVTLMLSVARGVYHAHTHGLLHRDLKPANILLDAAGKPSIADFGLAIALDRQASASEAHTRVGTVAYMSPEQARGGIQGLHVRSDIYSLGAVLYEMLTGTVPFPAASEDLMIARILGPEPAPSARTVAPGVSLWLEAICMKCLEKSPEHRYDSAARLADDLANVLRNRPPDIPPLSAPHRAVHWVRRNPRRAATISKYVVAIVAVIVLLAGSLQRALHEERTSLETNAFIATSQAGAALFQLREYADRVQQASTDPAVLALATADPGQVAPPLRKLTEDLDDAFVLSTAGYIRAQYPLPFHDIFNRPYAFRDYFACARSLAEKGAPGVCVARAFRSERDKQLKFALSAPLFDHGAWSGVLVVLIAADSVFGKVRMTSPEGGHVTALVGPRDVERDDPPSAARDRAVFVVHDGLSHGQEIPAPQRLALRAALREAHPVGQQFSLRYVPPRLDGDYEDPVRGFEGRWLAAFAPVGGTGYVVVVQSPRVSLLRSLRDLSQSL